MGYCDLCDSAGSVNRYGCCEVCGNEHDAEDQENLAAACPADEPGISLINKRTACRTAGESPARTW